MEELSIENVPLVAGEFLWLSPEARACRIDTLSCLPIAQLRYPAQLRPC